MTDDEIDQLHTLKLDKDKLERTIQNIESTCDKYTHQNYPGIRAWVAGRLRIHKGTQPNQPRYKDDDALKGSSQYRSFSIGIDDYRNSIVQLRIREIQDEAIKHMALKLNCLFNEIAESLQKYDGGNLNHHVEKSTSSPYVRKLIE